MDISTYVGRYVTVKLWRVLCPYVLNGEKWYNHFSHLHTEKGIKSTETLVSKTLGKDTISSEPFTRKEFLNAISNLKNNKAIGHDSIFNEMIKNSPKVVLDLLFKFINLCLRQSLISRSWCMELITPIFKDGKLDDPNNYVFAFHPPY